MLDLISILEFLIYFIRFSLTVLFEIFKLEEFHLMTYELASLYKIKFLAHSLGRMETCYGPPKVKFRFIVVYFLLNFCIDMLTQAQ